jgi:hypothetical protein
MVLRRLRLPGGGVYHSLLGLVAVVVVAAVVKYSHGVSYVANSSDGGEEREDRAKRTQAGERASSVCSSRTGTVSRQLRRPT